MRSTRVFGFRQRPVGRLMTATDGIKEWCTRLGHFEAKCDHQLYSLLRRYKNPSTWDFLVSLRTIKVLLRLQIVVFF